MRQLRTILRLVPDNAFECDGGTGLARTQTVGVGHHTDVARVHTGVPRVHGRTGTGVRRRTIGWGCSGRRRGRRRHRRTRCVTLHNHCTQIYTMNHKNTSRFLCRVSCDVRQLLILSKRHWILWVNLPVVLVLILTVNASFQVSSSTHELINEWAGQ